jgi:hypothetical protein
MQLEACVWDGLSHVIQHLSRDPADRRHFDFEAQRVARGNRKRLAATLHQETSAAFPFEIFVHKENGMGQKPRAV